jgi:hypothetical protein
MASSVSSPGRLPLPDWRRRAISARFAFVSPDRLAAAGTWPVSGRKPSAATDVGFPRASYPANPNTRTARLSKRANSSMARPMTRPAITRPSAKRERAELRLRRIAQTTLNVPDSSILPPSAAKTVAWDKKVIEYRADLTVEAIRKCLQEGPKG